MRYKYLIKEIYIITGGEVGPENFFSEVSEAAQDRKSSWGGTYLNRGKIIFKYEPILTANNLFLLLLVRNPRPIT